MMQLLAICAAFTFHLDSSSAEYLDMKSSVLGETPDCIERGSVSISTVYSVYVKLVLCSMSGLLPIVRLSLDPKLL